ncbi:hypothetical protein SACE_4965 [Saccharopolyspora erythraea NRRL 2338]|uniref:Uncharacterized protein n=1 Tax=Saccharopolyspora erythraea (strain ATCC 11635 / DSM 40517 / JCM 4748 / NBRC 13426 / NCIMB 8594 / NRRL 2338) TaxID=405948 RepID=A4FJK5_SACEN|nr:hypothetical protein SACE_4965 [Saccharopolyspora erythraea NRRL 2338]
MTGLMGEHPVDIAGPPIAIVVIHHDTWAARDASVREVPERILGKEDAVSPLGAEATAQGLNVIVYAVPVPLVAESGNRRIPPSRLTLIAAKVDEKPLVVATEPVPLLEPRAVGSRDPLDVEDLSAVLRGDPHISVPLVLHAEPLVVAAVP